MLDIQPLETAHLSREQSRCERFFSPKKVTLRFTVTPYDIAKVALIVSIAALLFPATMLFLFASSTACYLLKGRLSREAPTERRGFPQEGSDPEFQSLESDRVMGPEDRISRGHNAMGAFDPSLNMSSHQPIPFVSHPYIEQGDASQFGPSGEEMYIHNTYVRHFPNYANAAYFPPGHARPVTPFPHHRLLTAPPNPSTRSYAHLPLGRRQSFQGFQGDFSDTPHQLLRIPRPHSTPPFDRRRSAAVNV
jgi:hypothetical protein